MPIDQAKIAREWGSRLIDPEKIQWSQSTSGSGTEAPREIPTQLRRLTTSLDSWALQVDTLTCKLCPALCPSRLENVPDVQSGPANPFNSQLALGLATLVDRLDVLTQQVRWLADKAEI